MAMKAKPKHDSNGNVVGVVLDITFAANPPLSRSGKTLIDFSTRGNQTIRLEGKNGGDDVSVVAGINIYHYP